MRPLVCRQVDLWSEGQIVRVPFFLSLALGRVGGPLSGLRRSLGGVG
jgi:hypothetical protein